MYNCQLEKEKRSSNLENKDVLKSSWTNWGLSTASNEVTSDQGICCFCKFIDKQENLVAAWTLYAAKAKTQVNHVKNMTANWTEIAKVLQDEDLLIQISHEDVINPVLNVAPKNIENDILQNSKKETKMIKIPP